MSEKKRYKAIIDGKNYTIIGTESKEQLDIVTRIVNEQLGEIKKISSDLSNEDAAILMAINAVNDQVKKQSDLLQQQKEMKELRRANAHVKELEMRIKKMDELEEKARQALRAQGIQQEIVDPIQAQQILNQLEKQKIRSKSEE
ncbi:cell division protein ZapA [Enterococcus nangangensis]|uniref:cell division protein ZapA n=1 Tax=Enterococcus nangangensis TaxID=2559926 RepID=UPI001FE82640|nr:cell division protein ZapA [Enterococcus nangangensis]